MVSVSGDDPPANNALVESPIQPIPLVELPVLESPKSVPFPGDAMVIYSILFRSDGEP